MYCVMSGCLLQQDSIWLCAQRQMRMPLLLCLKNFTIMCGFMQGVASEVLSQKALFLQGRSKAVTIQPEASGMAYARH